MSNLELNIVEGEIELLEIAEQGPPGRDGTGAGVGLPANTQAGLNVISGTGGALATGPLPQDGRDGAPGATGPRGADGATGAQGIQGIQGADGDQGVQGIPGQAGARGATGATGMPSGLPYQFNASTSGAIGSLGYFALNNTDPSAATLFRIASHDILIHNDAEYINSWDDSTSDVKGTLIITRLSDNDVLFYEITGRTTTTGLSEFNIRSRGGSMSPALAGDQRVAIQFFAKGDKGDTGARGEAGTGGGGSTPSARYFATIAARNAATGISNGDVAIVADAGSGTPGHFFRANGVWNEGSTGLQGQPGASVSVSYTLDGNRSVPATGNIDGRLYVNTGDAASIDSITLAIRDEDGQDRRPYFMQKFGGTSAIKGFIEIENINPNTGRPLGALSMAVSAIATSSRIITLTRASGTTNAVSGQGIGGSGSTLAVFTSAKGDKGDTGATGQPGRDGSNGVDGVPGMQGATGAQGIQGVPGNDGATGPRGAPGADAVFDNTTLSSYGGAINLTGSHAAGTLTLSGEGGDIVVSNGNIGVNRTGAPSADAGNIAAHGYMQAGSFTTAQRNASTSGVRTNGRFWYNETTHVYEYYADGTYKQMGGIEPPAGPVQNNTLYGVNSNGVNVYVPITSLPTGIALTDLSVNQNPPSPSGSGNFEYDSASGRFTFTQPDLSDYKAINTGTGTSGQLNVVAQVGSNLQLVGLLEQFVGTSSESPTGSVLQVINRGSNAQDRQYGFRPAAGGGTPTLRSPVAIFTDTTTAAPPQGTGGTSLLNGSRPKMFDLPFLSGNAGARETLALYERFAVHVEISQYYNSGNVHADLFNSVLNIDVGMLLAMTHNGWVNFDHIGGRGASSLLIGLNPSSYDGDETRVMLDIRDGNASGTIDANWVLRRVLGYKHPQV